MDMVDDCEEGDSFLFCSWESFRGEGVWGCFLWLLRAGAFYHTEYYQMIELPFPG